MFRRIAHPSPALIVAMIALFAALSGGAIAATVVPLAKRALVADNAKKLQGRTIAQIAAMPGPATSLGGRSADEIAQTPGPASTVASLATTKTAAAGQLASGQVREFQLACDAGTAIGGGLFSDGLVAIFDTFPVNATTWGISGGNVGSNPANVNVFVVCLR